MNEKVGAFSLLLAMPKAVMTMVMMAMMAVLK